jgi:FMN phosphatase YigB (HAD superfamily)
MTDKKIKAVLFDLGETLLDFGKVNPGEIFSKTAVSPSAISNITACGIWRHFTFDA